MLAVLQNVEKELSTMLRDGADWQSLHIDYHPPYVERLWRQHGEYRVMLHRIHPCLSGDALLHAHPWPSAMRVVEGTYEMGVGCSADGAPERLAATMLMSPGSAYEMIDPDGWHSVRPLKESSLSVMVIGQPWSVHQGQKSTKSLKALDTAVTAELLELFRQHYV